MNVLKGLVLTAAIIAGSLAAVLGLPSCAGGPSAKVETLSIAMVPTEISAMLYIAENQKFFAQNGLDVTFKESYESGAAAAIGMLNGEADIAVAAEFPIVRQIFSRKDIVSFGTITRYENTYIIWRTDSGINTIADLKGKKVGVTLQTISEFYLGRTLDLNGMNIQQVTLVNTKAADAEKVLVAGEVDAVVTWEPWVTQVEQSMGKEATITQVQSGQYAYWNLVSTPRWIGDHPSAIERLIRSLTQAEGYVASHQVEAKAIVGQRLNFDDVLLEGIWKRDQFSLLLDQQLITAMEDEARWMIENNLTSERQVPNFLEYIYVDALQKVKPGAVNVIR